MKVCVLQPDYSTSAVDYQYYDPPRDLSTLLPGASITHVFLNKLTTYKQLKALSHEGFDIFVNLCEGYLEWEVPSIDVIHTLEMLNLPFTGPTSKLYDPTKAIMKYLAYCEGVRTPAYILAEEVEMGCKEASILHYPLFLKPAKAGDSLGIDEHSLVKDAAALKEQLTVLLQSYDEILIEEYIAGREFTVLVAANADQQTARVFKPVEYIFPKGTPYKTYALKTSELHPNANIPCNDPELEKGLKEATQKIFAGFNGKGYARLDFRVNEKNEIYFLEINFTCSVFYINGYEGSADYILQFDGIGQAGFLQHIIAEGIARHRKQQKKYIVKGNAIAGYGIYAAKDLPAGEIIFEGEGRAQRIITKKYVDEHWDENAKRHFRHYAYPISPAVYILWDEDPYQWAPQNHSCQPNTAYEGLNVLTVQPIKKGEELTIDYATILDESAESFACKCHASNCRKTIHGQAGKSLNL